MSVKPRDLLDQAVGLKSGTGEVSARAAISRAYYAALHRVGEILDESTAKEDDEGNTHLKTIAAVERLAKRVTPGRQAAIQIARVLRQLRRSRVLADYQLEEDVPEHEVEVTLARAQKVFELCDDVERLRAAASS